jgi:hypothetical protein
MGNILSELDSENLQLIFQETKNKLLYQMEVGDKLDAKASTIMGFIGVIIGIIFGLTFQSTIFQTSELNLFKSSVLLLIVSFFFAFWSYRTTVYKFPPQPENLVKKYLLKTHEETIEKLIYNFVDSHEKNRKKLNRKAFYINIALGLLLVSLVILSIEIFGV